MNTLSLTQEYFLCSVGEKGCYSAFDTEKGLCLTAAAVLELLLDGVLAMEGKTVSAAAPLPTAKQYLASLYTLVEEKQPVKIETIVEQYSFSFSDKYIRCLTEDVGDSLVQLGCAAREAGGLFGGKTVYRPDAEMRDHVVQKIRAELLEDGQLSNDIIALTALLNKSGDLSAYFSAYEKKDLKRRLQEIKTSSENQVVTRMMDYLETLFALIVVTVIH